MDVGDIWFSCRPIDFAVNECRYNHHFSLFTWSFNCPLLFGSTNSIQEIFSCNIYFASFGNVLKLFSFCPPNLNKYSIEIMYWFIWLMESLKIYRIKSHKKRQIMRADLWWPSQCRCSLLYYSFPWTSIFMEVCDNFIKPFYFFVYSYFSYLCQVLKFHLKNRKLRRTFILSRWKN